jgi:pimeloyl-ACP methyl ester carboxylesterase
MPAAGWPIVIFQHGFTRNREDMFAIADGFAQACSAMIAIDQPLHGITNTSDPFYRNQLFAGTPAAALTTGERTFDLDVQNNATGAAGADGKLDASGAHYINLKSLLTSRDNLRESVADLIHLTHTIPAITVDGKTIFDGSRIYFAGHSLGAIVGTTYLGIDSTAVSATLANPGGDIAQSLQQSPTLAPQIKSGLEAQGIVQGTQAYAEFFRNVQTVIDSGDPANYAAAAAAKHPIHMLEIVGGAGSCRIRSYPMPPQTCSPRSWDSPPLPRPLSTPAEFTASRTLPPSNFLLIVKDLDGFRELRNLRFVRHIRGSGYPSY